MRKRYLFYLKLSLLLNILNGLVLLYNHHVSNSEMINPPRFIKCNEKDIKPEISLRGNHWVFYSYIPAKINPKCNESVTYTTYGDHTYLDTLPMLISRWRGPISLALFTPGEDYQEAIKVANYYRWCVDESSMIRDFVSFHFVFPTDHLFKNGIKSTKEVLDISVDCRIEPVFEENYKTYRKLNGIYFPINTVRNVARVAATTHYILPSDLELYPSPNLIPQFLKLVTENKDLHKESSKVFVLPVFEIKKEYEVPEDKKQLIKLLNEKIVITFHKNFCATCHTVPLFEEWTKDVETTEMKMYELCLLDYDFLILNTPFLVHRPGIKTKEIHDKNENKEMVAKQNKFIKDIVLPELVNIHGRQKECSL